MLIPVSVIAPSTRVSSSPPSASVKPFSCSSRNQILPASTIASIAFAFTSSGSKGAGVGVGLGGTTAVGCGVGVGSGSLEHALSANAKTDSKMKIRTAAKT